VGQQRVLESFAMSIEQVALIPQCTECGEFWLPADDER
jgi:predicted Rdx family selenoprotein